MRVFVWLVLYELYNIIRRKRKPHEFRKVDQKNVWKIRTLQWSMSLIIVSNSAIKSLNITFWEKKRWKILGNCPSKKAETFSTAHPVSSEDSGLHPEKLTSWRKSEGSDQLPAARYFIWYEKHGVWKYKFLLNHGESCILFKRLLWSMSNHDIFPHRTGNRKLRWPNYPTNQLVDISPGILATIYIILHPFTSVTRCYPLVNVNITMENHHFSWETHYFYGHFK